MSEDATDRFERIYRQHFRSVLRYALARLEPESAKDAVAETFLITWRRLGDVPDDSLPWLLGTARKVISGQRRSTTRRDALRARLELMESSPTNGVTFDAEMAERAAVHTAMASLRESDREVLRLIAWDELTSAKAARVLGISRIAFGVRLHRARQRLAAAIEASERPPPPPRGREIDPPARADISNLPLKEAR